MTTVLMVDDNVADLDEMNSILTENGFATLCQPDGIHILDYMKEHQPDVIMLDLVMPKINGIEVLRELKEFYPDIPVIMCSAAGLEQIVALALRVGAAGYIVKPYKSDELVESIQKVISN